MQLDFALLADAATIREGLLHILGGGLTRAASQPIDPRRPPQVVGDLGPAVATGVRFAVALRLLMVATELGRPHKLESIVTADDGQRISYLSAVLFAPIQQIPAGELANFPLALNVALDAVPRFGHYRLDLFVDGSLLKGLPFVILAPPPQVQSTPEPST